MGISEADQPEQEKKAKDDEATDQDSGKEPETEVRFVGR